MNYKLQKTYVQIVGPHNPGLMNDWQQVEVEFAYGEDISYCPRQERFLLTASRMRYQDEHGEYYWSETLLGEPEYRHTGNGTRQRELEEALKYLKAFNKYLAGLPVRITALPDLLNALLLFYKSKTVSYTYYPHSKSGSTDHQKDSYPGRVVHVVSAKWQELLALPGRQPDPVEEAA